MHLTSNGCVVPRIEMLTYYRVRSAFNPRDALPLNVIYNFETTSKANLLTVVTHPVFMACKYFDNTQSNMFSCFSILENQLERQKGAYVGYFVLMLEVLTN